MRRVAVTGLGVIASLGQGVEPFFAALLSGRSGVRRLAPGLQGRLRSPIGAPVDFDGGAHFSVPRLRMLDRVSQLALVAAGQAIAAARLDFAREIPARCGVCVGTAMGGAETTEEGYHTLYAEHSERLKPYSVLNAMTNAAASWIGIDHGLSGPNLTYSTACSSGAVAIGEAARRIQCGDADVMLAGGAEAPLTFGVLRAWEAMRTLALPDPTDPSILAHPHRAGARGRFRLRGTRGLGARLRSRRHHPCGIVRLRTDHRRRPHHPPERRRPGRRHAGGTGRRRAASRCSRLRQRARYRHAAE
jgi:3-oxoacyl-[acyl-carrier-protein] synthase II